MGNRFASESTYHALVRAHGIIAAFTFLVVMPAAIMVVRFYTRTPGFGLKFHVYLQIITLLLATALFIIGFLQVGPKRDLTNPHHVIGLTIYAGILFQATLGRWLHHREKKKPFLKMPLKLYLHQWLGRALALLAIAQVALGLTLYGSPQYLFILYAVWVAFLLLLYFILSYRRTVNYQDIMLSRDARHLPPPGIYRAHDGQPLPPGPVLPGHHDEQSRLHNWAPFAAGAALLGAATKKSTNRSKADDSEYSPSRRNSFYTEKTGDTDGEGKMATKDKIWRLLAAAGAAGLAKGLWDFRKRRVEESEYDSVAPDTPSKKRPASRARSDSWSDSYTYDSTDARRTADAPILPGPGDPLMTAQAMSAAERPGTRRRTSGSHLSEDSDYTYDSSTASPSRRPDARPVGALEKIVGALGAGWFFDRLRQKRQERHARNVGGVMPQDQRTEFTSYTGPVYTEETESSILSTVVDERTNPRHSHVPSVPSILRPGARQSRHSSYLSREPAAATVAAADLAAAEEGRGPVRGDSSVISSVRGGTEPVASVRVQVHGDKNRNVTLRRLTKEEAAAERAARKGKQRAEVASSLSGSDVNTRRGFRRQGTEGAASSFHPSEVESVYSTIPGDSILGTSAPPAMSPGASTIAPGGLGARVTSPPPSFHGRNKRPKDSAYYSRPEIIGVGTQLGSHASPASSHGTWSALSPGTTATNLLGGTAVDGSPSSAGGEDAAERRKRRRAERQRNNQSGVDFT